MSKLIEDLMLDCFTCIHAEKNISASDEYKFVMIHLEYKDLAGRGFKLATSYAVNLGGKVSQEQSIKVLVQHLNNGDVTKRERLVSFSPSEVTTELLEAVNKVNDLFEESESETKRLYM